MLTFLLMIFLFAAVMVNLRPTTIARVLWLVALSMPAAFKFLTKPSSFDWGLVLVPVIVGMAIWWLLLCLQRIFSPLPPRQNFPSGTSGQRQPKDFVQAQTCPDRSLARWPQG
jgi:hypothetical protein